MEIIGPKKVIDIIETYNPATPGHWLNANPLSIEKFDFESFEAAINQMRQGYVAALFRFFGLDRSEYDLPDFEVYLSTRYWRDRLNHLEKYGKQLAEMGL